MVKIVHRISIHRHYYRIAVAQRTAYDQLDASLKELEQHGIAEDEYDSVTEAVHT